MGVFGAGKCSKLGEIPHKSDSWHKESQQSCKNLSLALYNINRIAKDR